MDSKTSGFYETTRRVASCGHLNASKGHGVFSAEDGLAKLSQGATPAEVTKHGNADEQSHTMNARVGIALGAGVVGLVAVVVLSRSPEEVEEPPVLPPATVGAERPASRYNAVVQRRLELLRSMHRGKPTRLPNSAQGEPRADAPVSARIAATPMARAAGRQPQANARAAPAQDAAPPAGEDLDDAGDDIPTLTEALRDRDPERRLTAVIMLSSSEDPQVIPILAQVLTDSDEEVRMAALEALSDFTGEAPVDAIEKALDDPSADIRYEALSVLADTDVSRARRSIERMLNDPDEDIRFLASTVLAQEANQQAAPPGR